MICSSVNFLEEISLEQVIRKELRHSPMACDTFVKQLTELYKPIDSLNNLFYNTSVINNHFSKKTEYPYPLSSEEVVETILQNCSRHPTKFFIVEYLIPGIPGNGYETGLKPFAVVKDSYLEKLYNQIVRKRIIDQFLIES